MDISSQAPPREGVGAAGQVARDGLKTRVRARARGARRAGLASRSGAPSRSAAPAHPASPQLNAFRERTARRGVNPFVYWPVRALLVPALLIYFRTRRIGREHLPRSGPLLFASNHRSFLDPFIIGTLLRRPVYYMAKRELFERRWQAWLLSALGAFPVDRGAGDAGAMDTAREILERGDCVVVFPEGTRVRPGPLGRPRRGVGRLALETGVPVVPVAVIGTEDARRGWRIRPHRVQVRVGRPLRFPRPEHSSPAIAAAVTERIWACVSLQWEWLGGVPAQPRPISQRSDPSARRRRAHQKQDQRGEARAA